jgi:hypothetical protein
MCTIVFLNNFVATSMYFRNPCYLENSPNRAAQNIRRQNGCDMHYAYALSSRYKLNELLLVQQSLHLTK